MIRIDYRTIDDLAREVCAAVINRKTARASVLRLHPELHDWVIERTNPGDMPMVWILPVSRGQADMPRVWEVVPLKEVKSQIGDGS